MCPPTGELTPIRPGHKLNVNVWEILILLIYLLKKASKSPELFKQIGISAVFVGIRSHRPCSIAVIQGIQFIQRSEQVSGVRQ